MSGRTGAGSLRRYVVARVLLAPVFLFLLLTVLFVLLRVAPGDPVTASLAGRASPERIAQAREAAGLDRPLMVQYRDYLWRAARGDLGQPFTDPRAVSRIVLDRFPATLELTLFAMVVAVVVGLVVGAAAARFRDTPLDVAGRVFGVVSYAAPVFWTGILAQLVFANGLGWFPTGNRLGPRVAFNEVTGLYVLDAVLTRNGELFSDALAHLVLPGTTLGLLIGGVLVRIVRVNLVQTLRSDYVEAARGRGVGEPAVLFGHALRNALVPVVTVVGLQLALLLGGAILTESTFSWPGLGSALVSFLRARDYAAVQGIVTFFAVVVIVVSVLIDVLHALIDPRLRY